MKLRKLNAVFSLISTVLILTHAISMAIWMLSQGAIRGIPGTLAWILAGAVAIHAIISFALMKISHKGKPTVKGKTYSKLNAQTLIQRISGVLMIVFTVLHILGAAGVTHTPKVIHAIVPPLFFTLVLAHLAVSGSKAFITLGIGNARFVKCLDVVVKVVCITTLIADVVGFYLFVC